MSTIAVTNLKHESASGNNIVLASDGTATFAEIISANKGITFPATQSASSNANTLDDYEEGTWTPVPINTTFSSATFQNGRYIKIGRFVTVYWELVGNFASSTGQGVISGLPFVPDVAQTKGGFSAGLIRSSSALGALTTPLVAWPNLDSYIYIESTQASSSTAANWANGNGLRCTGTTHYLTAD